MSKRPYQEVLSRGGPLKQQRRTQWFGPLPTVGPPKEAPQVLQTVDGQALAHNHQTSSKVTGSDTDIVAEPSNGGGSSSIILATPSPTRNFVHTSATSLAVSQFKVYPKSPWTEYEAALVVLAGHRATLAYKDGENRIIYSVPKDHQEIHLWALQILSLSEQPSFPEVFGVFDTSEGLFVVTEYLDISLAELSASQETIRQVAVSEDQIASISFQVGSNNFRGPRS